MTGGLLFAVGLWGLYLATGYRVVFELHIRDVLLVYFFTTIGLNARVSDLKAGGRPFVILSLLVTVFLLLRTSSASPWRSSSAGPRRWACSPAAFHCWGATVLPLPGPRCWRPRRYRERTGDRCPLRNCGLVLASVAGGPLARSS